MKFKLDENLPVEILDDLLQAGHEADTVMSEGLAGAPDSILMDRVQTESRVLLTLDNGIANIHTYPPERYGGIVLFRPSTAGRNAVLQFVRVHITTLLELELPGRLLVVTERGIRVR